MSAKNLDDSIKKKRKAAAGQPTLKAPSTTTLTNGEPGKLGENKTDKKPDKKAENKGIPKPKPESKPSKEERSRRREKSTPRPYPGGQMPPPLMTINPQIGPSGAVHFARAPVYPLAGVFPHDEFRGVDRNFRGSHEHRGRGRGRGQDYRPRDGLSVQVNLQHPGQSDGYLGPVVYPDRDGHGHYVVYRDGPPPPGATSYGNPQPPRYEDSF